MTEQILYATERNDPTYVESDLKGIRDDTDQLPNGAQRGSFNLGRRQKLALLKGFDGHL